MGGVGAGGLYGMRSKKGVMPVLVGGVAGSVADLAYAYMFKCVNQVQATKQEEPQR